MELTQVMCALFISSGQKINEENGNKNRRSLDTSITDGMSDGVWGRKSAFIWSRRWVMSIYVTCWKNNSHKATKMIISKSHFDVPKGNGRGETRPWSLVFLSCVSGSLECGGLTPLSFEQIMSLERRTSGAKRP